MPCQVSGNVLWLFVKMCGLVHDATSTSNLEEYALASNRIANRSGGQMTWVLFLPRCMNVSKSLNLLCHNKQVCKMRILFTNLL